MSLRSFDPRINFFPFALSKFIFRILKGRSVFLAVVNFASGTCISPTANDTTIRAFWSWGSIPNSLFEGA